MITRQLTLRRRAAGKIKTLPWDGIAGACT